MFYCVKFSQWYFFDFQFLKINWVFFSNFDMLPYILKYIMDKFNNITNLDCQNVVSPKKNCDMYTLYKFT